MLLLFLMMAALDKSFLNSRHSYKNVILWGIVLFLISSYSVIGQITPPGMGKSTFNSWLAFGFNQDLNLSKENSWESKTYIGVGRMSTLGSYNPFKENGIFVINQEFEKGFHKIWSFALGASYRRQFKYATTPPYELLNPGVRQEFRGFGKLGFGHSFGWLKIGASLKEEFQKYYTTHFEDWEESIQIRSRFKLKFTFNLTKNKVHRIILYSEQLFSTSLMKDEEKWSSFGYDDSRFSVFYSLSLKQLPFSIDIGYSNNLRGTSSAKSFHYLCLDLVFTNPFKRKDKG